jgi:hypothetical protein
MPRWARPTVPVAVSARSVRAASLPGIRCGILDVLVRDRRARRASAPEARPALIAERATQEQHRQAQPDQRREDRRQPVVLAHDRQQHHEAERHEEAASRSTV